MRPRYCTQCAGPLEWRRFEDERHLQAACPRCGHVEWQNPKPTVSGLVTRRGPGGTEVLLVRRAQPPAKDAWDCPGGFIDPDEHPEEALRREMREELTVAVHVVGFVGVYMDRYGPDGDSTLNLYYEVSITDGDPRAGSDAGEAAWFPLDRLPEPLAFDNNRAALRALAVRHIGGP